MKKITLNLIGLMKSDLLVAVTFRLHSALKQAMDEAVARQNKNDGPRTDVSQFIRSAIRQRLVLEFPEISDGLPQDVYYAPPRSGKGGRPTHRIKYGMNSTALSPEMMNDSVSKRKNQ